ncbi:MAG: hypothetical protein IJD58_09970 [Lachnospiraceae bacterium]|nr:hypothetical protein [Lachnospiraceae bacterium]
MRVQFTVSDVEWKKLEKLAEKAGYPDVPSYCKDTVLEDRTYGKLWQTVVEKISQMEKDEVFALRDLVDTPPANLGVRLYKHQSELGIEVQKKDSLKSNTFKKL